LDDAFDAGARASRMACSSSVAVTASPTRTRPAREALDPRRSQLRRAARRAAPLIEQAEETLEEGSNVIANGYLRLDREEWVRAIEKRRAALGG
jgi:hypothetical protein